MLITPARPACPFLWPSWNVRCLGKMFSNSPKRSLHCPLFSRGIRRTPARYALSTDEPVFANLPLHWAGCSSRQELPGAWLRTWPVRGAPWTFLDTPRPPEFTLSAHSASSCRGCHLLESEWLPTPQEQTRHEGWPSAVYGVWSGDQACVSSLL